MPSVIVRSVGGAALAEPAVTKPPPVMASAPVTAVVHLKGDRIDVSRLAVINGGGTRTGRGGGVRCAFDRT